MDNQSGPVREVGPKGELARYAFGYSDTKPGRAFWLIHDGMIAVVVYHFIRIAP